MQVSDVVLPKSHIHTLASHVLSRVLLGDFQHFGRDINTCDASHRPHCARGRYGNQTSPASEVKHMLALLERGMLDEIPGVGYVPGGVVSGSAGSVDDLSVLGL